jgi:hypothetical protein
MIIQQFFHIANLPLFQVIGKAGLLELKPRRRLRLGGTVEFGGVTEFFDD